MADLVKAGLGFLIHGCRNGDSPLNWEDEHEKIRKDQSKGFYKQTLDLNKLHKFSLNVGWCRDESDSEGDDDDHDEENSAPANKTSENTAPEKKVHENAAPVKRIFAKTLTGASLTIKLTREGATTVEKIKMLIYEKEGIRPDQQRLMFAGKQLEDGRILSDYSICHDSILHVFIRLSGGGGPPMYIMEKDFLHPQYDYTYPPEENVNRAKRFKRGNRDFERPYGWEKKAIRVVSI